MLTVIMLLTGFWWIGLIMVVWTLLVDISRVGLGVHYFSDILVGTLIGILMGGLAVWVFSFLTADWEIGRWGLGDDERRGFRGDS